MSYPMKDEKRKVFAIDCRNFEMESSNHIAICGLAQLIKYAKPRQYPVVLIMSLDNWQKVIARTAHLFHDRLHGTHSIMWNEITRDIGANIIRPNSYSTLTCDCHGHAGNTISNELPNLTTPSSLHYCLVKSTIIENGAIEQIKKHYSDHILQECPWNELMYRVSEQLGRRQPHEKCPDRAGHPKLVQQAKANYEYQQFLAGKKPAPLPSKPEAHRHTPSPPDLAETVFTSEPHFAACGNVQERGIGDRTVIIRQQPGAGGPAHSLSTPNTPLIPPRKAKSSSSWWPCGCC